MKKRALVCKKRNTQKNQNLLGVAIEILIPIQQIILPKNNIIWLVDKPIIIQPKAVNGADSNRIFLRPSHPERIPPGGASMIPEIQNTEANHEPW